MIAKSRLFRFWSSVRALRGTGPKGDTACEAVSAPSGHKSRMVHGAMHEGIFAGVLPDPSPEIDFLDRCDDPRTAVFEGDAGRLLQLQGEAGATHARL